MCSKPSHDVLARGKISKLLAGPALHCNCSTFHAYGPQVCVLKFCLGQLKCECFFNFPTSCDTNAVVESTYEALRLLLDSCRASGAIPIIGGDFNASIDSLLDGEYGIR